MTNGVSGERQLHGNGVHFTLTTSHEEAATHSPSAATSATRTATSTRGIVVVVDVAAAAGATVTAAKAPEGVNEPPTQQKPCGGVSGCGARASTS